MYSLGLRCTYISRVTASQKSLYTCYLSGKRFCSENVISLHLQECGKQHEGQPRSQAPELRAREKALGTRLYEAAKAAVYIKSLYNSEPC